VQQIYLANQVSLMFELLKPAYPPPGGINREAEAILLYYE
jgi:hypothetical protein